MRNTRNSARVALASTGSVWAATRLSSRSWCRTMVSPSPTNPHEADDASSGRPDQPGEKVTQCRGRHDAHGQRRPGPREKRRGPQQGKPVDATGARQRIPECPGAASRGADKCCLRQTQRIHQVVHDLYDGIPIAPRRQNDRVAEPRTRPIHRDRMHVRHVLDQRKVGQPAGARAMQVNDRRAVAGLDEVHARARAQHHEPAPRTRGGDGAVEYILHDRGGVGRPTAESGRLVVLRFHGGLPSG